MREYEVLTKKAMKVTPKWVKNDIETIINRNDGVVGSSYIISKLHQLYSPGIRYSIALNMGNYEWHRVSQERLTFIDNNLDLLDLIIKKFQAVKREKIRQEKP
ncbi:hypothetical protein V7266_25435 [Neobacillus drentensis]|uniref:hypothetical protein n=1 Tax=Bacillaceae TaxID=186817 RepID=UPI0030001352